MNEQELKLWRESLKKGDVVYFYKHNYEVLAGMISSTHGTQFKVVSNPARWRSCGISIEDPAFIFPTAEMCQAYQHERLDKAIAALERQRAYPLPVITEDGMEEMRTYKMRRNK